MKHTLEYEIQLALKRLRKLNSREAKILRITVDHTHSESIKRLWLARAKALLGKESSR